MWCAACCLHALLSLVLAWMGCNAPPGLEALLARAAACTAPKAMLLVAGQRRLACSSGRTMDLLAEMRAHLAPSYRSTKCWLTKDLPVSAKFDG